MVLSTWFPWKKTKLTTQLVFVVDQNWPEGSDQQHGSLSVWDCEDTVRRETGERLLNILLADKLNQELVIKIQQQIQLSSRGPQPACLSGQISFRETNWEDIFFQVWPGLVGNKLFSNEGLAGQGFVISRGISMMFDGKFWGLRLSFYPDYVRYKVCQSEIITI